MDNIKTWWNGLVLREQQLVAACAIVLVLGIFYWGIWTPISQAEEDAQRNLTYRQGIDLAIPQRRICLGDPLIMQQHKTGNIGISQRPDHGAAPTHLTQKRLRI